MSTMNESTFAGRGDLDAAAHASAVMATPARTNSDVETATPALRNLSMNIWTGAGIKAKMSFGAAFSRFFLISCLASTPTPPLADAADPERSAAEVRPNFSLRMRSCLSESDSEDLEGGADAL
eukprot:CAMPEP_0182480406 /NCGR_PEP_ID=MMETSP1319-20130603/35722_1 /TAXON_ID=172717 /ORGANISM="Bolidomonas pacifica, Strain RCC208" /LENGTH=122 /DNA_ID=CAMNT_0024681901 /DNA_START=60 /DNA_END=428 /DNA_ORIENTATION=+